MRKIKSFLAVLLALVMVITIAPVNRASADGTQSATSLPAPETEKKLIDNGDGTYTLALSVTGKTDTSSEDIIPPKANVVIVIDVSGSMNETTSHKASDFTKYTYSNQSYDSSTYYYAYDYTTRVYVSNGSWVYDGSDGYTYYYNGNVYLPKKTRLSETKTAACNLVDSLLANNKDKTGFSDIMEISLIKFANKTANSSKGYNGTQVLLSKSTNATTLKNQINSLSAGGGTNWQAALATAKSEADKLKGKSEEATSVIFLTDGVPTFYGSDQGYSGYYDYAGTEQEDNIELCWDEAKGDARAVVSSGYKLYNIFAFGTGTGSNYLKALTNYAYTGKGNSSSTSTQTYSDNTKTTDYFYDATDTTALVEAFNTIIEKINSGIGYVDVDIKDGITSMTNANVSTSAGGSVSNCKYYRSGGKYSTTANDGLGEEWTDAPKATITSDGIVDWKLGADFQLEDGVTYTITFVVWPSQESLDLVADLNNGKISYDSLNAKQKESIKDNGGTYSLKTNTDYPIVTYRTRTTKQSTAGGDPEVITSDPIERKITNPEPVGLLTDKLSVEKKWEDDLDESQRADIKEVKLDLYEDGKPYIQNITLDSTNNWKIENYLSVAPGMLITKDSPAYRSGLTEVSYDGSKYYILEEGHDYKFQEQDIDKHFELTKYEYHPMIIGKEVKDVTFEYDAQGNITGISAIENLASISATNTLKGGINLTKKVVDENGNDVDTNDTFTITMNLQNPDGTDYSYDYRIYYGQKNPAYATSGTDHRSDHITGNGSAEVTLYVGDTIRFVNVHNGTLFNAVETPAKGYELKNIDYKLGGKAYTDQDKVTAEDGTVWYKVKGNTASDVTVTNEKSASFYVYHSSDNTIERIPMTDARVKDGEFNIVNETKSGYIYGGYYKGYALPKMTDDQIKAAAYTVKSETTAYTYAAAGKDGLWMTDENGSSYEGDQTSWAKDKAYTEKGTAMTPVKDTVYYLKEVPDVYLQPATYVVYDERDVVDGNMAVKKLFQMTATDDANYSSTGFDVNTYKGISDKGAKNAEFWDKEIKVTKNGESLASLTAASLVSGHTGLIAARDVADGTPNYLVENAYYKFVPYHITLDKVKVNAVKRMTVYVRNTRFNTNWKKPAMTKTILACKASYSEAK